MKFMIDTICSKCYNKDTKRERRKQKMTAQSRAQVIDNNDIEYAIEKYEHTNSRWKEHWWSAIVEIYDKVKDFAKKYVIDPIAKTIKAIKSKISPIERVNWNCEQIDYPNGTELFYLIRGLDENGDLIFSKVGTTTRAINKRMIEHLRYYSKIGVKSIEVDRVYESDVQAEGMESWFRGFYIRKFGASFKKNDRFFGVTFDLTEADKLVEMYKNFAV